MGYIEENLLPNEKVITKASIHWGILVIPGIFAFIATSCIFLWLISLVASVQQNSQDINPTGAFCCLGFVWIILTLPLVRAIITYFTTEFAVTTRRVIGKTGFIRRQSLELMLSKVESINVSQSAIGRMFGYGTIIIIGSGGTRQPFPSISDPMELRQKINTILERMEAGGQTGGNKIRPLAD